MRLSILLLLLSAAAAHAQKGFQTRTVSIFKNNTAFFQKTAAALPTTDGRAFLDDLPEALEGTFWLASPGGQMRSAKCFIDTVRASRVAAPGDVGAMLRANMGKKVRLRLHMDTTAVVGFVEEIGEPENRSAMGAGMAYRLEPNLFLTFRTMAGLWRFLPVSSISSVDFFEKPDGQRVESATARRRVRVDFKDKKPAQPLDLLCLEAGLNWVPTYLVELLGDDRARLRLTAEVVNRAEDIEGAEVRFVAGVPNFLFANRLSDFLSLMSAGSGERPSMGSFQQAVGLQVANQFSNAVQSNGFDREEERPTAAPPVDAAELGRAEDLFFYSLKDFSLKKGENALFEVFQTEVAVEHVYEANLPDWQAATALLPVFSFQSQPMRPVHVLKISNGSPFVFTTGPAFVVGAEGRPVAQDKLGFAPPGGSTSMKLTEAPDIEITHADRETGRSEKTFRSCDKCYWYDQVEAEGQIRIKNRKDKAVKLVLRRTVRGKAGRSSDRWETAERVLPTSYEPNATTDLRWAVTLRPGEERMVSYGYSFFGNPRE